MSMLAERKQKQRWYLNPRANKEWAQDSSKFGQRMLEKMGWSAGKGLGANEDGMTEHINVKYKNDIQGIGYKLRDDQWTQHENNFTELLANLGSGEPEKLDSIKPDKSLEKKSQASRARVHYHKFTRGKDLSSKSEKDLANIFGRKTLEKAVIKDEKEESDTEEKETKKFGVVTVKSGNMTDYFKSKLTKLGDKLSSAIVKDEESESELGTTTGFGFNPSNKENNKQNFINFVSTNSKIDDKIEDLDEMQLKGGVKRKIEKINDENLSKDKKKKKNKRKKRAAFDNKGNDINIAEEICYDNPCLNEQDTNQNDEDIGLDNLAFNSNDEPAKKKRKSVTFASPLEEYSVISDKFSKKKKKKRKQNVGIDNFACEEIIFEGAPIETKEETKQKKKRKSIDNVDFGDCSPAKKFKNKKKHLQNGIENLACTEISPNDGKSNEVEYSSRRISPSKKCKKKRKSTDNGITNLACEESALNCAENLGCSVNLVEEGIESITNAIENYQTELENEMNERKNKKLQKKSENKSIKM